jgi:integration host factor subunit alpha
MPDAANRDDGHVVSDLSNTVTRSDLCNAISDALPQLSRPEIRRLVDEVLTEIGSALIDGKSVRLHGFGVFKILGKSARIGRNPKTGQDAIITARRVVVFSPSPILRAKVNGEIPAKTES